MSSHWDPWLFDNCSPQLQIARHKRVPLLINKLYIKSKCIKAYEGFRNSVQQSLLIAIKF